MQLNFTPETFIDVIRMRASTTPSSNNKLNHQLLAVHIDDETWDDVISMITAVDYYKPLSGVILCLNKFNTLDFETHSRIIDLFEQESLT